MPSFSFVNINAHRRLKENPVVKDLIFVSVGSILYSSTSIIKFYGGYIEIVACNMYMNLIFLLWIVNICSIIELYTVFIYIGLNALLIKYV